MNKTPLSTPIAVPTPVSVLMVSHGTWGAAMIEAAEKLIGRIPELRTVSVESGEPQEAVSARIDGALDHLTGKEILFLVDLFGSTPARICSHRHTRPSAVLTGLNLAMLFKLATADRSRGASVLAAELAATGTKSIQIVGGRAS